VPRSRQLIKAAGDENKIRLSQANIGEDFAAALFEGILDSAASAKY